MRMPVVVLLAVALLAVAGVGGWVAADRLLDDDGGGVSTATPTRTRTAPPSASLSPDGNLVAYLVLANGSQDPGRGAEAWVLEVRNGQKRHLADGFDLRTRAVWSEEGDAIVIARNGPQTDAGGEGPL